MRAVLVTKLRTGCSPTDAINQLCGVDSALYTVQSTGGGVGGAQARSLAYAEWASTTEAVFRNLFVDTDFVDGLLGDRYWRIVQSDWKSAYLTGIVGDEIKHQRARLGEVVDTLIRWKSLGDRPGELFALDTNVFLQCRPFNEIPWVALFKTQEIRLILTMPVLNEIESKKWGNSDRLRKRARRILPLIDRLFGETDLNVVQVARDGKPVVGVTLEILGDERDQRRASIDMDEEFLDRCEFLQQATGRPVTVVTADTGMKVRTRVRGGLRGLTVPKEYAAKNEDDTFALRETLIRLWSQRSRLLDLDAPQSVEAFTLAQIDKEIEHTMARLGSEREEWDPVGSDSDPQLS